MFEKLRKPLKGKKIFAPIIFGMICLTFVFVGLSPDNNVVRGGAVAEVNNESISFKAYQQAVTRMEDSYRERLSGIPEAQRQTFTSGIKKRALEQLIEREALGQELVREGVYASDLELRDSIAEMPYFQRKGRFQHDIYVQLLAANRETSSSFEAKVRRDLALTKVQDATKHAMVPVALELDRMKELKATKLNITFLEYDKKALEKGYKVSKSELNGFLKEETSNALIKAYYDKNLDEYSEKAKIKASHLLIKVAGQTPEADQKALKKIKELQAKITTKNFAAMAFKHSEDVGSKMKKGDLGYIEKGRMVPPFEKAVFSKKEVGIVKDPIKTQFGYHLIYVTEKQDKTIKSFAKVQSEIAKKLITEKVVMTSFEEIGKYAKAQEATKLDKLVKKFALEWKETGEFALDQSYIPKLSDPDKILAVVLKSSEEGVVLPEVVESRGKSYLLKRMPIAKKVTKNDKKTLNPDPTAVSKETLAGQKAGEFIGNWIQEIKKQSKVTRHLAVDSVQL